jgi:hypothetical protein
VLFLNHNTGQSSFIHRLLPKAMNMKWSWNWMWARDKGQSKAITLRHLFGPWLWVVVFEPSSSHLAATRYASSTRSSGWAVGYDFFASASLLSLWYKI